MPITGTDKIKIKKYIKEHAIGDIYYADMCDALNKKVRITDVEFLEYFTDYVVEEFCKDTKIYVNYLTKIISVIDVFIDWVRDNNTIIKEEIIEKIRSFRECYDNYLKRNGLEKDLKFNESIDFIIGKINTLYPPKEKKELLINYINKVENLNKTIDDLRKKLQDATGLYDKLERSFNKKSDKVDELSETLLLKNQTINDKSNEINKLYLSISELNEKINLLEQELSKKEYEIDELLNYKKQCEELNLEVEKLKKEINDNLLIAKKEACLKNTRTKLETLVYQKLLLGRFDINEVLNYAKEQGYNIEKNEIVDILKSIKKYINIDNSFFSSSPIYRVSTPKVLTDEQFLINIPNGCKYYDIMLVSDFHLSGVDKKVLKGFEMLNDYCVNNGINLILNLGDFFEGYGNLNYEDAVKNYKIIEQSISKIPSLDGIYHAVLGGNHDLNILKYGFDPIGMLTDSREDFINLGYTHGTIVLRNELSRILGRFDIHHPNTFDFAIDLDEDGINSDGVNMYLNNLYQKLGRSRDTSYIDIFGHTHKSQFNYADSYYYVAPYFEDLAEKACHLRIYIDDQKQIKYMVFMPLIATNRLYKSTEIVYKKTL